MDRHLPRLFVILSFCLLIAIGLTVTYVATRSLSPAAAQPVPLVGDQVKEIAGYRNWTKINSEPQVMPRITATLCAPVSDTRADDPKNPHRNKYVTVYVNDIGRPAMLEQVKPRFPTGSVIVKEKLSDKASQAPELLTVMIKRGKGFNPTSGDWEYMVVDGPGTNVSAQGKLENCQSCHIARPGTDYVFRTYLPDEVLLKLK